MSRKGEGERTMADAEQDALEEQSAPAGGTRCACGSERFVLEALTCPECGREYEPIRAGGRVLRGEFRGFFEDEEEG